MNRVRIADQTGNACAIDGITTAIAGLSTANHGDPVHVYNPLARVLKQALEMRAREAA